MSASAFPRLRHRLLRASDAQPSRLVVLFHGLGGNLGELAPLAERWLSSLPSTGFLLLEAPDRDYHERTLLSGEFSGDWYKFPRLRSEFGADEHAYESMVEQCISDRCDHVNLEADQHANALGLGNDRMIMAGFSQGAALSAYAGLRRRCLGVLPMGGPCPPRERLLPPRSADDPTSVCVVVGDNDHCAPHEEIRACFSKYAKGGAPTHRGAARAVDGVHVIPGMRHEIAEPHATIGLAFLKSLGCR